MVYMKFVMISGTPFFLGLQYLLVALYDRFNGKPKSYRRFRWNHFLYHCHTSGS